MTLFVYKKFVLLIFIAINLLVPVVTELYLSIVVMNLMVLSLKDTMEERTSIPKVDGRSWHPSFSISPQDICTSAP